MAEIDELAAAVLRSAKYRWICPDTVRRIGAGELAKGRRLKAAVKATKARLHQVFGAFDAAHDYGRLFRDLESAWASAVRREPTSAEAVRQACRSALREHASTGERLPILDRFYGAIFAVTGVPGRVLDLACGLHPLGLPWMGLGGAASYMSYDIDGRAVALLNRWFALIGLDGQAVHHDILCEPPAEAADLAFLLKSLPCLERQEKGAGRRLLDALRARHVVVSYPVASLGGRDKGMRRHYERGFLALAAERPWRVERLDFETELVFVVEKGA